jgi:two-component system chemotaxis response regulator CheB
MLQPQHGFTGRLLGIRLEDLLEMFCFRRESTELFVTVGGRHGTIYVHDGTITHAEYGPLVGEDAVYEILGWQEGEFYSQVVVDVPSQSIFTNWHSLLMEAIRQKDEIRHALGPEPAWGIDADSSSARKHLTTAYEQGPPSARIGPESIMRILVVDDSRLIRKILQEIIDSDPELSVAGYAANGREALAKIDELHPDLIILDWDMPVMTGSTALMHIMIRSPCPVVMLSGFVGGEGTNPFDLLCLGAIDFMRKPHSKWRTDGRADDLTRRIKQACRIKFERIRRIKIPRPMKLSPSRLQNSESCTFLSVFGSALGGCTDLIRIVTALSEDIPSAVLFLHDMQPEALGAFIDYLDRGSRIPVRPVEPNTALSDGMCYVHPITLPLELVKEAGGLYLKILPDRPASDVLDHFLLSASSILGKNLLAGLLSGEEGRGIDGLRAVKKAGGITVIQDPASSLDPGMAEAALREEIVDHVWPADNLAETFQNLIRPQQQIFLPSRMKGEVP